MTFAGSLRAPGCNGGFPAAQASSPGCWATALRGVSGRQLRFSLGREGTRRGQASGAGALPLPTSPTPCDGAAWGGRQVPRAAVGSCRGGEEKAKSALLRIDSRKEAWTMSRPPRPCGKVYAGKHCLFSLFCA